VTKRLATETSPYLLQHATNPVDWYPWGTEALERARAEDKPIFLSIGYSACHWCHVMAHESFEDPAVAAQLNRDFVAIKVDREERPDLDDVYMAAVQTLTGTGGWPMSVFLTPALEPFFGGTYFPPDDRHGLPGFPRVLDAISDAYRDRRDEVVEQGRQLAAHLREQLEVAPGRSDVERRQLDAAAARLRESFDPKHGGFGGAPKFPAPMTLEFLLRTWRRTRDDGLLEMVTVTLDRMAEGGIHDQVGGGFARYSTDAHWLVPHFEKMLYDNAQLAHTYLEGYRATGQERYADVARRTLDFVIRELATEDAASRRRSMRTARGTRDASTPGISIHSSPRWARPGWMGCRRSTWPRTGGSWLEATGRAARSCTSPGRMPRRPTFSTAPEGRCLARERRGSIRGATTSSSPPGTGWRCALSPMGTWYSETTASRMARAPAWASFAATCCATGDGCGGRPAAARPIPLPSPRTT
jgi:hypothetical protein